MSIEKLEQIILVIASLPEIKGTFLGDLLRTIAQKEFSEPLFETDDPVAYNIQPMSLLQRCLYTILEKYDKRLTMFEEKMGDDCKNNLEYQKISARVALAAQWLQEDLAEIILNNPEKAGPEDDVILGKSFQVVGIPHDSKLSLDLFGAHEDEDDENGFDEEIEPENTFQGMECKNKLPA